MDLDLYEKMDGIETSRRIRNRFDVPVVYVWIVFLIGRYHNLNHLEIHFLVMHSAIIQADQNFL